MPASVPIGEAAALGAAALWAISTILWTRQMAVSWPQAMNLFKLGICLPLFVVLLLVAGPRPALAGVIPSSAGILLVSGVIGMSLGDTSYFAALSRIGARRTMMLQTLTPLFAAGLALVAGQSMPGSVAAAGVALVIVGLILVLRERPSGIVRAGRAKSGVLFALGAAFCQALGIVLTKKGLEHADLLQASTIRMFGGVIGMLVLEAAHGQLVATVRHALRPPSLSRIIPASLMGSFVGFFLFQLAVRSTDPSVAAALTGTSPLFVAPLSVFFLGEMMRAGGWIGTILAVAGVALVMMG
jgi:drug/metabolite transporter (DMT)-like permease